MFRLTEQVETSCARWFRDKRFLGFSFGLISRQENEHRPQKFYKFPPVLLRTKKDPGEKGGSIYIKFYKIHSLLSLSISKKTRRLIFNLVLLLILFTSTKEVRTILRYFEDRCTINAWYDLIPQLSSKRRDWRWINNIRGIRRHRGSLIADRDDVFTRIRARLSNSARRGRVPRHASPTPRYEGCHADFTPSGASVSSGCPFLHFPCR